MKKTIDNPQRRRTLFATIALIVTIPLGKFMSARRAEAAELPHLDEDDPTAKILNYHHDATEAPRVDKSGITPAQEQFCYNCRFIQSDSGEWRPCEIFPGKAVNANGWCSTWINQSG
jgi:hypothetical protein